MNDSAARALTGARAFFGWSRSRRHTSAPMRMLGVREIVIKRERGGYRGEAQGVEIFVPSRIIELPGKEQGPHWAHHLVHGFITVVGLFLTNGRVHQGPLPSTSGRRGKARTIDRPNQRLTLGDKSIRQVYVDDAMSRRNTPIRVQRGARIEVRDDDGEDDGIFDTAAFWLVHSDGSEQVLLENIARDERGTIAKAIGDALQTVV